MSEKRDLNTARGMWDVFVSHASEDKTAVVEPLVKALEAAGLSVWYDRIVLTLGDSLRQRIEHGLANSRYGIVVLSPAFFAKHWPQQELNGLAQKEVNGEKVILPVWHNISPEEVAAQSPILADRMAAFWSDGPNAVVAAILDAVRADKALQARPVPASGPARVPTSAEYSSLVLLSSRKGKNLFVRTESIETAEAVKLVLLPSNPRESAFLAGLRDERRQDIDIAYDLTALSGRIESVKQARSGGKDTWTLELKPQEPSWGMEVALNKMSADEIAALRARRILLDEKLTKGRKGGGDPNDMMFEVFVRGTNAPLEVQQSPFPALYRELQGDRGFFVAAARLVAVLWLRLSGTVEHVFQLDLGLQGDGVLAVRFEGQRHRQYVNQEPAIIRFEGTCPLV